MSYTQIQAWEHERRTPTTEYAIRLARALNTTVENFSILTINRRTSYSRFQSL
ncbi:MAG: helix-turn-helix domain-containing protein [Christensenellaceae bacterium]